MKPHHHLDPATLVSYAAGALPEALAAVAATHLSVCRHCRELLRDADAIGGQLLAQQQPDVAEDSRFPTLRAAMLERLDEAPAPVAGRPAGASPDHPAARADLLPAPLHPYFGATYSALRWRWVAPGVRMIRARGAKGGNLILLKIAPGKSMPVHSHGGSELTQILQGAYDDKLGHFATGDMADLDSDVEHQPVTTPGVPCVCAAALDAPLRFQGWLARKLQPMVGL